MFKMSIDRKEHDIAMVKDFIAQKVDPLLSMGTYWWNFVSKNKPRKWRLPTDSDYSTKDHNID